MSVVAGVLIVAGMLLMAVSCLGVIRLPDFYSRAHAAAKSETLGIMLVFGGLIIYNGATQSSLKLFLILLILAVTSPTSSHVLSRAAFRSGLEIWRKAPEAEQR